MCYKEDPKVLVISHNVFSPTSNMGKTLSMFFKDWDRDNIAQLYFHSEIPNSNICLNYYRITDFDLVNSILKIEKKSTVFNEKDINNKLISSRIDTGMKEKIYRKYGAERKPYTYMLRNILWATNKWKSKQLDMWIKEFNPDAVFYASGDYVFSIKIALYVCKKYNLPMITFFGDDYYYLDGKTSLLGVIHRLIYKNYFIKMFQYLTTYFTASDKMLGRYSKGFNKNGYAIMTSAHRNTEINNPKRFMIAYVGNLGLGRWEALIEIGKKVKKYGHIIDVYSGEKRENILNRMTLENGINFHGQVSIDSVDRILKSSSILIHVESISPENKKQTRYSMSTKIAESLGSGACIFAYGPKDISSIEYLINNDAACVATHKDELDEKLCYVISNSDVRMHFAKNALKLAEERHDYKKNSKLFEKIIKGVCNQKKRRLE